MYKNIKPHWYDGKYYDAGAHTITEKEYNALGPEGKALYDKETKSKAKDNAGTGTAETGTN